MTYNSFFSFSDSPFLDDLDQRFLFFSKQFEFFLRDLAEFVSHRQGIAVISGDEGVGKTMLTHALLERLPPSLQPLIITRPPAEPLAIPFMVAQSLGMPLRQRAPVNIDTLAEALLDAAYQGKYFLLVLDDAHLLTDQHLEDVYVLAQMEHQGQQIMPILLEGRTGLMQKLDSNTNQRLHELIRYNLVLSGLTFEETTRYIDHRLQQVGSSFKTCFAEGCSGQLFSRTGGIPRFINQVCDQALNRTWQEHQPRVTRDLIGIEEPVSPFKPLTPPPQFSFPTRLVASAAAVLLAGLVGYMIYTYYFITPPRISAPVADKAASPAEKLTIPPQQGSPPGASEPVSQVQPHDLPAETPASRESEPPQVLPQTKDTGVPAPKTQATEADLSRPSTHLVAPNDGGLLKIATSYYSDEQGVGYSAILLANPQITNEDIIYPGQQLILPKMDKANNFITFNNNYYYLWQRFYNPSQVDKTVANLKKLDIRFLVRETWLPDTGPVYRIFLGGYERQEELKQALALAKE